MNYLPNFVLDGFKSSTYSVIIAEINTLNEFFLNHETVHFSKIIWKETRRVQFLLLTFVYSLKQTHSLKSA